MTRILFAGGGTAGHVFPALAVARALTALAPDIEPVFVGTRDRLEDRLVPAAGFRMHHVDALPLPRRLSPGLLRVPGGLRAAVRRCEEIARAEEAVAAVTFGGYVSFPVSWAASRLDLPLVVHEQNAVPGLANRFAGLWVARIAVTFPGSADRFARPDRVVVTGNPVRDEILALDVEARRGDARQRFGLKPDLTTVLVFGGSQGARSLNRAVVRSYGLWSAPGQLQILHAAGANLYGEAAAGWERARAQGSGPLVRCVDFIDDMGDAYAAADVVVCRAGATSIAELTALGKPSVLVPYPHATRDHQMHNARALAQVGGAQVIEDGDLTARRLVDAVEPWIADAAAGRAAADAARAFGRRDAAEQVARLVLDALRGPVPMPTPGAAPLPDEEDQP
jgi:UDP-N-acetylglucosamine--N-acetylmuramyl-(pentapeptide) pyrophosphoryl-undecaprenol N-acetylglucosamine transferase